MVGEQDRWQEDLFVAGPLRDLIPEDHILRRVDKVLDLSWLRGEVLDCYCADKGRPSIDPESAVRLMLAGYFSGIVHDRKLMREAQVNLAIRWFAGYRLHEKLPDHSSLTHIRQRWGAERFRRIFERTVQACVQAGLVSGETVHVDATLVRADVSWESLTRRHVEQVLEENPEQTTSEEKEPPRGKPGRPRSQTPGQKRSSTTDPDATMTTNNNAWRLEPSYKQHTAVDDKAGVIIDVAVTTGETSEGQQLPEQLARVEAATGIPVRIATADAGYAHSANYQLLEEGAIDAVIPPQAAPRSAQHIPARRFKYGAKHQTLRCPAGKPLYRAGRNKQPKGWRYRARACDCSTCPLRPRCLPERARVRAIVIVDGYEALLRARRRKEKGWDEQTRRHYDRHRGVGRGGYRSTKKPRYIIAMPRAVVKMPAPVTVFPLRMKPRETLMSSWGRIMAVRPLKSAIHPMMVRMRRRFTPHVL